MRNTMRTRDRRRSWSTCSVLAAIGLALAAVGRCAAAGPPAEASIQIDAARVEGPISPLMYGQFLEYMFGCIKGGLHAELLRDRSFEGAPNVLGLPRGWERYPDQRNDGGHRYALDEKVSYPPGRRVDLTKPGPDHALRVDLAGGRDARHGVYQAGVPVRAGVPVKGYLWLRGDRFEGRVLVALEPDADGARPLAEAVIEGVGADWKQCAFTLGPTRTDPLARFVIVFQGRGRLWVDQASLLPGDAVDGVRRDVFERVEALRPGFVRWPGGNVAQDYHWTWGVGPRDQRATWTNTAWAREPEPSDFATNEYIQFCRNLKAEPTICVNAEGAGATAEEAANWVEYCNGPASSKFGSMRAAAGHPEPFGVRWWEIGNEIFGDWVRGHTDPAAYARHVNRYVEAMRKVDPTIKIIACGDNDQKWNRAVLRGAGKDIDVLAIHHYYGGEAGAEVNNLMARPLHYERFYRDVAQLVREEAPGRPITLAINEWGLFFPPRRLYSIDQALYAARLMNVFERSADIVTMTAVSDLVNGWPGGIIQAGRTGLFVSPSYLVNQLYAAHLGAERLAVRVDSPVFDSSREGKAVPVLDAVASRSRDGRHLYVKAVNTDHTRPLAVSIFLEGAQTGRRGELALVTASAPEAINGFDTPDAIAVRRTPIETSERTTVTLPPASVAVIALEIVKAPG